MSKIFAEIFPFFDHLYIFQNFEYEMPRFLRWFINHPLSRNLQKKHRLSLTQKTILLIVISLLLMISISAAISVIVLNNLILIFFIVVVLAQLSPLFQVAAQIILLPLESYTKNKVTQTAGDKIKSLNNLITVAIVGSYAKTSIKEMLYTLLWKDFRVVKTPKSYNTPLSIARTALDMLKGNTDIFIVEMDAYHRGEIDQLCKLVKPKYGIITSIAPQHLERFGSMETLAYAQFELADNLPQDGVLFLNSGYEWIDKLSSGYQKQKQISLGRQTDPYFASDINQTQEGLEFDFHTPSGNTTIKIPLYGAHHAQNFVAAAAIAHKLGLSLETIKIRARLLLPTEHRLEIKKSPGMTIIDNTYNANPSSVLASLDLLKKYPGSQKILMTPGLIELGTDSRIENIRFMEAASQVADEIIIVGNNAKKYLMEGLEDKHFPKDKIHPVQSTQEGLSLLSEISKPNSVVLLENDLPDQYS